MATPQNERFQISVVCRPDERGWSCDVRVAEGGSQTSHVVTVSDEELARYGGSAVAVDWLVEQSFRFLLVREGKNSILSRFALSEIERYFPEFPAWAARQRG